MKLTNYILQIKRCCMYCGIAFYSNVEYMGFFKYFCIECKKRYSYLELEHTFICKTKL